MIITLKQDKARLIKIFESKTEDGKNVELTIYSSLDKRRPPHSTVYHDIDTIKKLETEDVLKISDVSNNIDEHAPGFAGPPYYAVTVFAQKIREKIQARKTVTQEPPQPLPQEVNWVVEPRRYLLEFDDGKKLEFNNTSKPSAQYFFLFMENHGLPVSHEAAKKKTGKETNTEVKNLVKTLRGKITHNMLTTRVKIVPSKKGDYILHISPKPIK